MSDNDAPEHATSVGQTGGLPGDNAHWRTGVVPEDELASTVQRGDVAPGGPAVDPEASPSTAAEPD